MCVFWHTVFMLIFSYKLNSVGILGEPLSHFTSTLAPVGSEENEENEEADAKDE